MSGSSDTHGSSTQSGKADSTIVRYVRLVGEGRNNIVAVYRLSRRLFRVETGMEYRWCGWLDADRSRQIWTPGGVQTKGAAILSQNTDYGLPLWADEPCAADAPPRCGVELSPVRALALVGEMR